MSERKERRTCCCPFNISHDGGLWTMFSNKQLNEWVGGWYCLIINVSDEYLTGKRGDAIILFIPVTMAVCGHCSVTSISREGVCVCGGGRLILSQIYQWPWWVSEKKERRWYCPFHFSHDGSLWTLFSAEHLKRGRGWGRTVTVSIISMTVTSIWRDEEGSVVYHSQCGS